MQRGSGEKARTDERKRSSGVVLTLLVLAFASLAANQWHDRQHIEDVQVVGATDLSSPAVSAILTDCLKQQRRSLMLSDVRDSIEGIPFVRSVSVYFSGVRGITAEVQERTPVAHVVMDGGRLRYVDAQGVILPPTARCIPHCVPIIRTHDLARVPAIVSVLNQARSVLSTQLYASVSEIIDGGDGELKVLTDHVTWHLGPANAEHARQSFADMNVFWERTLQGGSLPRYAQIDLRWKHHVVIRNESQLSRS